MNEHSFMALTAARRAPALAGRADKADKREAILRAAIETFAARGFFNAQVADVARAAGVAAGTVYLYFRGKDDLLISIFERTMKEAIAEGRQSVDSKSTPPERLREIAALHLGRLGRDRDLAIVFQVELRQSTKFMERFSSHAPAPSTSASSATSSPKGQAQGPVPPAAPPRWPGAPTKPTSARRSSAPRSRPSPPAGSSTPRSPTSRAPRASRPARSTSTSAARTTCSSRSSSAR